MSDDGIIREKLTEWDPARYDDGPDRGQVRWLRARVLATAAEAETAPSRGPLLIAAVAAALILTVFTVALLSRARLPEGPVEVVRVEDSRRIGASEPLALPASHLPPATPSVAAIDPPSTEPPTVLERPVKRRRLEMTGRRGTRLIWSIQPNSAGDLGVAD